jgi:putative two-component system response regulator
VNRLKKVLFVLLVLNTAVLGLVVWFVAYHPGVSFAQGNAAFAWTAGCLGAIYLADLAASIWILRKTYTSLKKTDKGIDYMARCLSDVMFFYDMKTEQIKVTSNYRDFFDVAPPRNYKQDFIISTTIVAEEDLEEYVKFKSDVLHKNGEAQITIRLKISNGAYEWFRIVANTMAAEDGSIKRIIGKVSNVNEYKTRYEKLEYLLQIDQTTTLYNKQGGKNIIDKFLADKSNQGGLHALLSIDIDGFKAINDTFGHSFGDEVLISCARRLKETLDLSRGDVAYRFGGDEFVVFLPNTPSKKIALKRAEDFQKSMNFTVFKGGVPIDISISLGIAFYPINGNNSSELYNKADMAMYSAKGEGKNRSIIYQKSMQNES